MRHGNSQRLKIATELLLSEQRYVDSLFMLQNTFIEPLMTSSSGALAPLSSSSMSAIFANFVDILHISAELLALLQDRLDPFDEGVGISWNSETDSISDIFCLIGHYFKMYKTYCRNFNSASVVLNHEIVHNYAFNKFLSQSHISDALAGLSLQSYLLLPVQRVPRYRLLLSELMGCTPHEHHDYSATIEALSIVSEVALGINEAVRQQENWQTLLDLEACFLNLDEPLTNTPSRVLLKQGSITKESSGNVTPYISMSDFLAGALSAAKADLATKRAAGTSFGTSKKVDKTTKGQPKWMTNKGAKERAKTDGKKTDFDLSDYDLARSRKALERKQREYRRMFNKGTDMALTGDAADNLLIDFDRKWAEGHRQEASSDDDRQLLSDDEEDPMMEIQDEFGRARRIRKSEVLIHEKPVVQNAKPQGLIYGPHLQRFNPDAQKKDAIWEEEKASREVHYDPAFEVRQRGAGYINLGRGEERRERMEDLESTRDATVKTREGHGLVEPEAPLPMIIPEKRLQEAEGSDYVHPSRKHQLPTPDWNDVVQSEVDRNAKRTKVGEAFLDSLL
ncbi:protein of unknown function [Taphrina deformans PYCC 5710]|uniref:DH domain-containing protein n=1 Tax=Taphrina deformans (strain PYCC 5710 / ATCC 11124 / CBS 356.35 / IMI 108563 / JCM 9778 / NBRC 8474) TaxID=1097556 RepID=R4XHV6_TAPDE|nr:protein of unknown function [Taphrina deformans PYCC 5710]|eukprot:CCG84093.1 protein of unknown function [Taphrina deformans PYCC 5710]